MELDGAEVQVLIMGSPYKDTNTLCIASGFHQGKGKHILEDGINKRARPGTGTATEMRKHSRNREDETKVSVSAFLCENTRQANYVSLRVLVLHLQSTILTDYKRALT